MRARARRWNGPGAARGRASSSARPIAGTSTPCGTPSRRRRAPPMKSPAGRLAIPSPDSSSTLWTRACSPPPRSGPSRSACGAISTMRSPSPSRAPSPIQRTCSSTCSPSDPARTQHARDHVSAGARGSRSRGDAARPKGHHDGDGLHGRPHQGVRPDARALHAHLRGGADRHGPRGGRMRPAPHRELADGDVLVRRYGSDRQPGEQDPLHVRRPGELPGDLSVHDGRRNRSRRAALAEPVLDVDAPGRAQDHSPLPSPDAKGLLKSAIRDNNPVVSFECSRLATVTGPVPDGDHLVQLGVADVKRPGTDVTIVGLAYYVGEALAVAEELAKEGISAEVVDPRTLVPLDVEALRTSVRKTGRVVIVDEAPPTCSAASEIAALIAEDPETFRGLKAPVRRVCAVPVPVPYSPPLEQAALPRRADIKNAVYEVLKEPVRSL